MGRPQHIAIVGGGAAGCFCAIGLKRRRPDAAVTLFEAGPKLLAKVALTGGGRCNLTNSFRDIRRLEEAYPRGAQLMKRALNVLGPEDTQRWWEAEGVRLVTQEDQCVFPVSQDAMQVVRTLERGLREAGVRVCLKAPVEHIEALPEGGFRVEIPGQTGDDRNGQAGDDRNGERKGSPAGMTLNPSGASSAVIPGLTHAVIPGLTRNLYDKVIVTVGGSSQQKLQQLLPEGVEVTPCVPSLFTFKIPDTGLRALMGTVVEQAGLSLAGTKFRAAGTLLLTDWGVSGPATLRLSSYAARHLAENNTQEH